MVEGLLSHAVGIPAKAECMRRTHRTSRKIWPLKNLLLVGCSSWDASLHLMQDVASLSGITTC